MSSGVEARVIIILKSSLSGRASESLMQEKRKLRGAWQHLESLTGISAQRWGKVFNLYQRPTLDMIEAIAMLHPEWAFWMITGITDKANVHTAPPGVLTFPEQDDDDANWLIEAKKDVENKRFPFSAKIPDRINSATISDRLIWVISEFASCDGKRLFSYLEEISKGTVPASEWSDLILRNKEPSAEMVGVVCSFRPYFTEWVIRGSVSYLQVDPTDKNSEIAIR